MSTFQAQFITSALELPSLPTLRKQFTIAPDHGAVVSAKIRLTALGVVEATINGVAVAPDVLTPGWSSFEWRLRYAEHDVTDLLRSAGQEVTLGLAVGHGWYLGRLGWGDGVTPYGGEMAALAETTILFEDGHEQVIGTDETWSAHSGPVTRDSIYDGQSIDARLRVEGWGLPGLDDSEWGPVKTVAYDQEKLVPYTSPGVRRQLELSPVAIWETPAGNTLVDFGQNLVGWVRVEIAGQAGDTITLTHAEVLEDGELGTRPLRAAEATDRYILSGGHDVFEPTFTFHGFRYVQVDGLRDAAATSVQAALTAVVVSTDLTRTGHFTCSDLRLNRLHENVVWGMRGNFLDVPTDCPQRDERLGWTGDIAVFAPTATFLFDVESFLSDWLRDLELEQAHHNGVVPFVVPDVLKYLGIPDFFEPFNSTAFWSDAAVWVPWALWQAYGNVSILNASFASMTTHVRHVRKLLSDDGTWSQGFQFGDWLDPDAPPERADAAKADGSVVATAAIYRSARMVAEAANVLGKVEEAQEFEGLADDLYQAFRRAYIGDKRIKSDCTTVYSLAIAFDLLIEDEKVWAGQRLAELAVEGGFHISTGFAGTPFILDALTSTGHVTEAFSLLTQEECPSWLYPVTMGATTIWERWDSMLPDGSINSGEMTSFNHYALGAVADWMHRTLGGLAPLDPGYRRILFAPTPGGGVTWAETSLVTPYGPAAIRWEQLDDGFEITALVPENTTALLRLPDGTEHELGDGQHHVAMS